MISKSDIERVFKFIDREISMLELNDNINPKTKKQIIDGHIFVRNTFQEVCYQCAIAEGIIKPKNAV
jgi:hypothetical protein